MTLAGLFAELGSWINAGIHLIDTWFAAPKIFSEKAENN